MSDVMADLCFECGCFAETNHHVVPKVRGGDEMKTQTLISGQWKSVPSFPITESTRPELRGSQPAAIKALKDKQHVILNAPTGWGKSFVIITLLLHKLLHNPQLRGIIVVPQTIIAPGFLGDWSLKIPGVRHLVDWVVQHNLCHAQSEQTVDTLIEFLRGGHRDLGDRILICTHATLARCYRKLQEQHRLSLIRDVVLWIDEAHHIMNAQIEGRKATISNSIGALVKYCLKYNNHVGMATATFMRGDMRHILSDDMSKLFTRFDIPYDVYFKTMRPVESFEFNVVCGGKLEALRLILKETKPTIIYLAKRGSYDGREDKYKEVKQIRQLLPRLKVVDLVTEKGRDKRKAQLADVDVIIALDTCKEGFNWPQMERSIILGERRSVPEMVQMIGRLFRYYEGKKHVEVHQILPTGDKSKEFKDYRNSILTVVFAAMLLEDVFLPIKFQTDPRTLGSRVPSTEAWQALMRDFLVAAQLGYEESLRLAPNILKKHDITDIAVWDRLWQRAALLTRKQKGLRLDVPFEILKKTSVTEGLLSLVSGLCGTLTFTELRKVIGRELKHPLEWVIIAENIAAKNKEDILPRPTQLRQMGVGGLVSCMWTYPQLFKHIPQEKISTHENWVIFAENLAKINNELLPCYHILQKNGHHGLIHSMKKYPELFKHISRANKKGRTPEDWVRIAEQEANKNNGILPHSYWLSSHNLAGLVRAMRLAPELFKHIPQTNKKGRTPEEWVCIAKHEAKKNNGILPHVRWLQKNGLGALTHCMSHYPQLFKHISQEEKIHTLETWVMIAEDLAKENGGLLQNQEWLRKNGFDRLAHYIRKYPTTFKHIPQKSKRGRTPTDWVCIAEQEAKKNNGTLPNVGWLQKNGFASLYTHLKRNPDLFKHIPQKRQRQKKRTAKEWVIIAKKLVKENNNILPTSQWLTDHGMSSLPTCIRKYPHLFKHIPRNPSTWLQ